MKRPPFKHVPASNIVWTIVLIALWAALIWVSSLPRG